VALGDTPIVLVPPPRAKSGPDDQPLTAIEPPRRLKPTPEAIAAVKARREQRIARSLERDGITRPMRKPEMEVDDNPNAEERWSRERIDLEAALAESHKRPGELPESFSTWVF
jgi:hypothetical protein